MAGQIYFVLTINVSQIQPRFRVFAFDTVPFANGWPPVCTFAPTMARKFVIGDIHGALKALEDLLEKIAPTADDQLIFLGDLADGWPETAALIRYCIQLEQQFNTVFIMGNHDSWCEGWLQGSHAAGMWLAHGGKASMESYASIGPEERIAHLHFLQRMLPYFVDQQNRLYIHAGFTSRNGPAAESYPTNFYWDRSLWEMAVCLDPTIPKDSPFYPKRLTHFTEIYVGHTPTLNYKSSLPMRGGNVWNVDTGAAFNGPLTAMEVSSKTIYQSRPVPDYYPGIQGRTK